MNVKAIFLDIDGVLNANGNTKATRSKSRCGQLLGIDKDKVKRLAKIVNNTNAILILISTWKVGWQPHRNYTIREDFSNYHAKYLDNHLKKKGNLIITDKTKEKNLERRGMGIKSYLVLHPEITDWIVLDDEIFSDYQEYNILPHLIKTDASIGLTDENAAAAIQMLNNTTLIDEHPHFDPSSFITNKTYSPQIKEEL